MARKSGRRWDEWLTPEGLLRIEAWARDGLTNEEIARNMGVSTATLYNWKRDNLEILDALKRGKEVVDIQVENALFKRAIGYQFEEVVTENVKNTATGKWESVETRRIRKEQPPDVTAAIFWLKNRKPDVWRDKKDVTMDATVKNPFDGISTDEIKKLIQNG